MELAARSATDRRSRLIRGIHATLTRYSAPTAEIHRLLDLKDPKRASLIKQRLQAIRQRLGSVRK